MKKLNYLTLAFATAISLGFATSCSNNSNDESKNAANEDPKMNAEEHNDAKFSNDNEKDAQFLVDAADINLKEISAGKLAATNGITKEVRDLGTAVSTEHQKAYDELAALAKKKNISVPSAMSDKSQKECNNLSEKRGSDFDKDFSDAMVSGHKDAIEQFDKAAKECTDPDIQAWAANMLPSLRMHLDQSMVAQEKSKNIGMK
ncbi:hypothetical protein BH11BAC1_BH11BAC1_03020 [soil metagenome]